MSRVDKHAPGAFCRVELATSDQPAARAFYTALFDWQYRDSPIGPTRYYTSFMLEGRNAAACYTLQPDEVRQGIPPHWNLYIAVDNAEVATQRAVDFGASLFCGPFDVSTHGRMSTLADPTGAVFSIWEPRGHPGIAVRRRHGSFCWADLSTPDPARASVFYAGLFGWSMHPGDEGYIHIANGSEYIGGIPPASRRQPNEPPHWQLCFQVDDCTASTEKARQLGANIFIGPMTIEHVGLITVLADPQGAIFSLFQPFPNP